ncbi:MAG: hypothetical protein C0610_04070 [Desulfobacteraceae bacterium]|nr:MAG: hypothetical protein C0610_04070 [Desulfobacteraceae bacterium]
MVTKLPYFPKIGFGPFGLILHCYQVFISRLVEKVPPYEDLLLKEANFDRKLVKPIFVFLD